MLSRGGVDNATLIRLYKTFIRPLIEYGYIATLATKTETMAKFQRMQNEFLRVCLNLPRYIRTDLLHEAACLETVKERVLVVGRKHFDKLLNLKTIKDLCHQYHETVSLNNFQSPLDYLM